jgi:hypothetical protein
MIPLEKKGNTIPGDQKTVISDHYKCEVYLLPTDKKFPM